MASTFTLLLGISTLCFTILTTAAVGFALFGLFKKSKPARLIALGILATEGVAIIALTLWLSIYMIVRAS